MSEPSVIEIINENGIQHEFNEEILLKIHDYISDEYKESSKIVIKSPDEAELLTKKSIIFHNEIDYIIEAEEPVFRIKMPLYFINFKDGIVTAVINPEYKKAIVQDSSSLKFEYRTVKSFPFLKGKLLNDGFAFTTKKEKINDFYIENISTKRNIKDCESIANLLNPSHKENIYLRLEDDAVWIISNKTLETLKTQHVSSGYDKLVYYPFDDNNIVSHEPVFYKNKEFLNELAIPLFAYSKKKPQILRQLEFMLSALYGENFTMELNYDEDEKADIAIIKLVNSTYKLEINDLAYVYKNNKLVNLGQKSDPYLVLMKELIKPYIEHLPIGDWSLNEYQDYKEMVHSGLFY